MRTWTVVCTLSVCFVLAAPAQDAPRRAFPALPLQELTLQIDQAQVRIETTNAPEWSVTGPPSLEVEPTRGERAWKITLRDGTDATSILLQIPSDVRIQATLERGTLRLERLIGPVQAAVTQGEVTLHECAGAFQVRVGSGNIAARVLLTGASEFVADNGNIDLVLLDPVAYPLTLTAPRGRVRLLVPEGYAADGTLRTESGSIRFLLPTEQLRVESERRIEGSWNGGGPPVRIEAGQGILVGPLETMFQEAPALVVPKARYGILIDGIPESAWLWAPEIPIGGGATFRILWDERRLYFWLRSAEETWETVRLAATRPDSPEVERDDGFDVVLRVAERRYRITVTSLGVLRDVRVVDEEEDPHWESRARAVAVLHSTDWEVELAVPYQPLDWTRDRSEPLRLQIARVRGEGSEWTVWPGAEWSAPLQFEESVALPDFGEEVPLVLELRDGPVPERWVVRRAGIPATRRVPLGALGELVRRIEEAGWFGTVELQAEEQGVRLRLAKPRLVQIPAIRVAGAQTVDGSELLQRLGWRSGWESEPTLKRRRALTEQHLRQRGYRYAQVRLERSSSEWILRVDEGTIRQIEVIGGYSLSAEAVKATLHKLLNPPVYRSDRIPEILHRATEQLQRQQDTLQALEDAGMENGTWRVQIRERYPRQIDLLAWDIRTRATGYWSEIGVHVHRGPETRRRLVASFGRLRYGKRPGRPPFLWTFRLGGMLWLDAQGRLRAVAEWSRGLRHHPDEPPLSPGTGTAAYLFDAALQNWHADSRVTFALQWYLHPRFQLNFQTGTREVTALRRLPLSQIGFPWDGVRPNRPVDTGSLALIRAEMRWDGRRHPEDDHSDPLHPTPYFTPQMQGIYLRAMMESVQFEPPARPSILGPRGSLTYWRARWEMGLAWPLGSRWVLMLRGAGQWVDRPVPRSENWRVGGPDRLRSRAAPTLIGDGGAYIGAELWRAPPAARVRSFVFAEAARAWYIGSRGSAASEVAVGIGASVPLLRGRWGEELRLRMLRVGLAAALQRGNPFGSRGVNRQLRLWLQTEPPRLW